ncbi:type II toxin-antitoxin system RelE/ParE family toxin [Mesorhizobium sp.]|uniref:type II toxin-antitoxin system RelE/ParE family toxin n=1 Tax=Mesorhizobium sp. TaxID=1871066 RepID=UPI0025BF2071|nr:type II toxin-antitoxin system RelE/ParE family toxin [Mesorhizobium sp.]
MDQLFSDAVAELADFPRLGRTGKIRGTRELNPHESYRLVYEVEGETCGCWPWCIQLAGVRRQTSDVKGRAFAPLP